MIVGAAMTGTDHLERSTGQVRPPTVEAGTGGHGCRAPRLVDGQEALGVLDGYLVPSRGRSDVGHEGQGIDLGLVVTLPLGLIEQPLRQREVGSASPRRGALQAGPEPVAFRPVREALEHLGDPPDDEVPLPCRVGRANGIAREIAIEAAEAEPVGKLEGLADAVQRGARVRQRQEGGEVVGRPQGREVLAVGTGIEQRALQEGRAFPAPAGVAEGGAPRGEGHGDDLVEAQRLGDPQRALAPLDRRFGPLGPELHAAHGLREDRRGLRPVTLGTRAGGQDRLHQGLALCLRWRCRSTPPPRCGRPRRTRASARPWPG